MLMAASPEAEGALSPARLWGIFLRRWPILVGIVAATTLAAFLYSTLVLAQNPTFKAAATLDISPTRAEVDYANAAVRGGPLQGAATLTQTYAEYARSRPMLEAVVDDYVARVPSALTPQPQTPGLRSLWNQLNYGPAPAQEPREGLVGELAEHTTVSTVAGTHLLRIEVEWDNRQAAAWFANEIASRLIASAALRSELPGARLNRQLVERLERVRGELNEKQARVVATRGALGIADIPAQKQAVVTERLAEEARLTDELARISSSAAQVSQLQRQANGKLSASTVEIDKALALERPRLAGLRQSVGQRQARVASLNSQLANLNQAETTISALERDIAVLQGEATALADRLNQVQLDNLVGGTTIRVVEEAKPPLTRDSPKVMVNTALGFIAGCALAGMFMLLAPMPAARVRRAKYEEAGPRVYPGTLRAPKAGRSFTPEESREIKARLETWLAEPLMDARRPLHIVAGGRDAEATALFNLVRGFLQSRGEQVAALSALNGPVSLPAPDEAGEPVRPIVYHGGLAQSGRIPPGTDEGGDILVGLKSGRSGGSAEAVQSQLRASGWRDPFLIRIEA